MLALSVKEKLIFSGTAVILFCISRGFLLQQLKRAAEPCELLIRSKPWSSAWAWAAPHIKQQSSHHFAVCHKHGPQHFLVSWSGACVLQAVHKLSSVEKSVRIWVARFHVMQVPCVSWGWPPIQGRESSSGGGIWVCRPLEKTRTSS